MPGITCSADALTEDAPLLHELQPLEPVPSAITNLASTLGTQEDQATVTSQLPLTSSRFGKIKNFSPWLPELDPNHPRAQTLRTRWSKRTTALGFQQLMAALVLAANLVWTAWAQAKFGTQSGIGTMFHGNCTTAKKLNLWLHLLINILSTFLLGASNFCMQLLVAPTRYEIDQVHKRAIWLDIGVPSITNLRRVARKCVLTWFCLGFSSALLHLFWNSAIFISIPTYTYTAAFATEDHLVSNNSWGNVNLDRIRQDSRSYEQLNSTQCIERYVNGLNGGKDVVVVTSKSSSSNHNSTLLGTFTLNAWPWEGLWVCASPYIGSQLQYGGCTKETMKQFSTNWTVVYDGPPFYAPATGGEVRDAALAVSCLSGGVHTENNKCGLHFSAMIMAFVCVLNLIKFLSVCWTAYYNRHTEPLATPGDAVMSFLRNPDVHTQGMCTLAKEEFPQGRPWSSRPKRWNPQRARWYRAASRRRWLVVLILCISSLILVAGLLGEAIAERKRDLVPTNFAALWREGLGAVSDHELVGHAQRYHGTTADFFSAVLVANAFQLLFSFLYFMYNGLLTCMLVAAELNHYRLERKPLRVSAPVGLQRSSYFLSLPYRFGVPLTICSGLLHWFISQSIFFVHTVNYDVDGNEDPLGDTSRVGFSPIGIILSFSLATAMVIALIAIGFIRRDSDREHAMPLMSTCSAAISAGCHRPTDDTDAHLLPVRWGVVSSEGNAGHCSFTTAKTVRNPTPGSLYL